MYQHPWGGRAPTLRQGRQGATPVHCRLVPRAQDRPVTSTTLPEGCTKCTPQAALRQDCRRRTRRAGTLTAAQGAGAFQKSPGPATPSRERIVVTRGNQLHNDACHSKPSVVASEWHPSLGLTPRAIGHALSPVDHYNPPPQTKRLTYSAAARGFPRTPFQRPRSQRLSSRPPHRMSLQTRWGPAKTWSETHGEALTEA